MVALVLLNWGEETVLRKIVAIVLWIWGRGVRIEDNSLKCFEENGSFSTLDLRKRWQDWWKFRPERRQEKSNSRNLKIGPSRKFTKGNKNYRGDRKKEALASKGVNRDSLKGRGS